MHAHLSKRQPHAAELREWGFMFVVLSGLRESQRYLSKKASKLRLAAADETGLVGVSQGHIHPALQDTGRVSKQGS